MLILRGPNAGRTAQLHQFANDWMTISIDGQAERNPIPPTSVRLDADEIARMRQADPASAGLFWKLWHLYDDGTFSQITTMRQLRRDMINES